jgi:hypothetical protein
MLTEMRELRKLAPQMLADIVIALLNKAGVARVTPETERRLGPSR